MSVSISTPYSNVPSLRSDLDTVPSDAGRSEILTHDINRLLQHLHELDQLRGQEAHELADNVRAIRDELYDLSDFLHQPPKAHLDESVGRTSIEERPVPAGPRELLIATPRAARPISLSPPLRMASPSSAMSSNSFLSSQHSEDDLWASEQYSVGETSPRWPLSSPGSSPSTPSTVQAQDVSSSSSTTTSGPYVSSTSSSELPPLPPPSESPSVTSSPESAETVRPQISLAGLRELLDGVKEQMGALWDGQLSTNHMLDELSEESDGSSVSFSDLDRLRDRLRDLSGQRDQIQMPIPMRSGPSLDEELAAMLRGGPQPPLTDLPQPPPLIRFQYQPASRASRPRSASPTLPPRPHTVPREAPVNFYDGPRRRPARTQAPRGPPRRRPDSTLSYTPVVPTGPTGFGMRPQQPDVEFRDQAPEPQPAPERRPGPQPPAEPVLVSWIVH
jgi:hypothetical protein